MFGRIKSFIYRIFITLNYTLLYRNYYERVYVSKDYDKPKLIIEVKSKETGKEIFDIIRSLKKSDKEINLRGKTCKVIDYVAKHKNVIYFKIDFTSEIDTDLNLKYYDFLDCVILKGKFPTENIYMKWFGFYGGLLDDAIHMNIIKYIVSLALDLNEKGYSIKKEKIQKINIGISISEILECFELKPQDKKEANKILIRWCHYYLSGKNNFEDFYGEINKKEIIETSELPYNLGIVKNFYDYYLTGNYSDAIDYLLKGKDFSNKNYANASCKNLILNTNIWNDEKNLKEENSESKTYQTKYGDLKIFKKTTGYFGKFFKSQIDSINHFCKNFKVIIDFNANIIGFKEEKEDNRSITDIEITNQIEMFDWVNKFLNFLFGAKKIKKYKIKDSNLDISNAIVIEKNWDLKFKSVENLYSFLRMDEVLIKKQAVEIFCSIYKNFIEKKYGKIYTEKELLKIPEIRYLSPIVTQEFIKFYFCKEIDYIHIYDELKNFIKCERSVDFDKKLVFDARFEYNPFVTPFKFDYEIEEEYGEKIKEGIHKTLNDGRKLIIFNKPRKLEDFTDEINKKIGKIKDNIGDIENEHLKFIKISEVIYSKNIVDGVYSCLGYITTPVKGKRLKRTSFLKLNNIQLMYVFYYYFCKFTQYYIPYRNVLMDEQNMIFYVDILNSKFEIKKNNCTSTKAHLDLVIKNFIKFGYNANAFFGFDYSSVESLAIIKQLDKNNLEYCNKHNIYYFDGECPVCKKINYYLDNSYIENNMIFEDAIARHYELDSNYNVKIYKPEAINGFDMENRLIAKLTNITPEKYEQDCFIPVKIVYNSSDEFIGYIYNRVSFEKGDPKDLELCIDLEDTNKLTNLHRLKGIIRLLIQIKSLIQNGFTFSRNPYGYVFLNKGHKQQVQLMNIEFIDKNGQIQDTISWTYEYISKIINLDENLEDKDLINGIKENLTPELDKFINRLQDVVHKLNKYCNIHKMYYSQTHLLCPICMDGMNFESVKVKNTSKKDITSKKKIGEGGEAKIYKYNSEQVAKVFNEDVNYNLKIKIIAKIMQKAEKLNEMGKIAQVNYVIPEEMLIDESSKQFLGYVMQKVEGKPLAVLKDKKIIEELKLSKKDILEILIKVGRGIEELHKNDLFIGDLNGRNILFDSQKQVYFLDFDGMGTDDISPEFFTDGYIDPNSQKNQNVSPDDDWYSFAIQAFYYLTYTHPFNGIYMKDGQNLDIVQKMELRISLLGNHGIKPPSIAEPWDWMSEELKSAFLNIFEKEQRSSLVPFLIKQYDQRYKGSISINYKFMAKNINPFGDEYDIKYVINLNVAIAEESNQKYAIILTKKQKYLIKNMPYIEEINKIKDVTISKDEKYAFVIGDNEFFLLDLKKDMCISQKSGIEYNNIVVNDTSVYYIEYYKEKYVITMDRLSKDYQMENSTFEVNGKQQQIKFFRVEFNQKFVVIQADTNYSDEIYCNNEKLCDINCENADTKYNIVYDNITKTWLVINEEKNIVVIKPNGKYKEFKLKVDDNKVTVDNISYINGKLYIPGYEELLIVNVKKNVVKKLECNKIMNPTSKICKTDANGFSVITNGIMYEVYKD